jgi:predicted ester cyclase
MSVEDNKAVVRRFMDEILSQGNYDLLDEFCSPELAYYHCSFPDAIRTPEDVKGVIAHERSIIPNGRWIEEEMIAEGDKVVYRGIFRGTHTGISLFGIEPAGTPIAMTGIAVFHFEDDLIEECWVEENFLAMLLQLGAVIRPRELSPQSS